VDSPSGQEPKLAVWHAVSVIDDPWQVNPDDPKSAIQASESGTRTDGPPCPHPIARGFVQCATDAPRNAPEGHHNSPVGPTAHKERVTGGQWLSLRIAKGRPAGRLLSGCSGGQAAPDPCRSRPNGGGAGRRPEAGLCQRSADIPYVRQEKRCRQSIFSTHNANLPVLGDGELSWVSPQQVWQRRVRHGTHRIIWPPSTLDPCANGLRKSLNAARMLLRCAPSTGSEA